MLVRFVYQRSAGVGRSREGSRERERRAVGLLKGGRERSEGEARQSTNARCPKRTFPSINTKPKPPRRAPVLSPHSVRLSSGWEFTGAQFLLPCPSVLSQYTFSYTSYLLSRKNYCYFFCVFFLFTYSFFLFLLMYLFLLSFSFLLTFFLRFLFSLITNVQSFWQFSFLFIYLRAFPCLFTDCFPSFLSSVLLRHNYTLSCFFQSFFKYFVLHLITRLAFLYSVASQSSAFRLPSLPPSLPSVNLQRVQYIFLALGSVPLLILHPLPPSTHGQGGSAIGTVTPDAVVGGLNLCWASFGWRGNAFM